MIRKIWNVLHFIRIYFVPANDQIINLLKGGEQEEMFVFRRIETRPRRSITPPPDSVFYSVGVRSVADIRDRLIELGTEKMKDRKSVV